MSCCSSRREACVLTWSLAPNGAETSLVTAFHPVTIKYYCTITTINSSASKDAGTCCSCAMLIRALYQELGEI